MGRKKKEVKRSYKMRSKHGFKGRGKTHNRICEHCSATENLYYCYTGPGWEGKLLCPEAPERVEYMEWRESNKRG